jgi:hypothetical protein
MVCGEVMLLLFWGSGLEVKGCWPGEVRCAGDSTGVARELSCWQQTAAVPHSAAEVVFLLGAGAN